MKYDEAVKMFLSELQQVDASHHLIRMTKAFPDDTVLAHIVRDFQAAVGSGELQRVMVLSAQLARRLQFIFGKMADDIEVLLVNGTDTDILNAKTVE